jgi:type II secretory pathway pseudopilin PulG
VARRTPPADWREAADRGETLIELLVTIVIMGLAVTAILGALVTSVTLSGTHRRQTVAGSYLRAQAEAVESAVAASPTAYTSCAATSAYSSFYSAAAPYTASVTAVAYWNPTTSTFAGTCGTDSGVQSVTLRVASSDNKIVETMVIIIRRPCRSTTDFPADAACS